MTETALEKAQRKFQQAKAALDAIKARESAAERKKDTRRKIVLGGALLELSKTDREASALVTRLIAGLSREHDKKLFEKSATVSVRKEREAEPVTDAAPDKPAGSTLAPKAEPRADYVRPASGYGTVPVRRDREEI